MADTNRTLLLSIRADIEVARQQLGGLVGIMGDTATAVDARITAMETGFKRMSTGIGTAGAAVAGFFGGIASQAVSQLPQMLISAAKNAIDFASSIGETSQQLGIGTKFLQEYRYAATQSGASTEQADQAMKQFGVSVGKAANGNKTSAAAFKALGVEIADANGKLKPTETLFNETADAIAKVDDPARRVADAMALFGRTGAKLLPVLEGGSKGLSDYAAAANALGLVLTDDMINKLDGLDDKMAAIKQVISAQMAVAIADNADAIIAIGNAAGGAIAGLGTFLRQARELASVYHDQGFLGAIHALGGLNSNGLTPNFVLRSSGTAGKKAALEGDVRGAQQDYAAGMSAWSTGNQTVLANLDRDPASLKARLNAARTALKTFLASPEYQAAAHAGVVPAAGSGGDVVEPAAKAAKTPKAKKPGPSLEALQATLDEMPKVGPSFDKASDSIETLISKLDGTGRAYDDIISKQLDFKNTASELANLPKIELIDPETVARMEALNQFSEDLGNNMAQAIVYGRNFGDAMVASLEAIAAKALSKGFSNLLGGLLGGLGGGLGGFLGGLFGGAHADGGIAEGGKISLVGERGPELIVPRGDMHVIPNHMLGRSSGGSGGGGNVTNIHVDARGATDPAAVRQQVRMGILEAAPTLNNGIQAGTIAKLKRPQLPGGRG